MDVVQQGQLHREPASPHSKWLQHCRIIILFFIITTSNILLLMGLLLLLISLPDNQAQHPATTAKGTTCISPAAQSWDPTPETSGIPPMEHLDPTPGTPG